MKIVMQLAALVLTVGAGTAALAAPEVKWTMSYLPVNGSLYYDVALALPDRIAKATRGRVQITATGSLIAGNRLLEAVRDGEVQMSMPLAGYYTASQPLLTLTQMPGIAENLAAFQKVMRSDYGKAVYELLAREYKSTSLLTGAFCPQTLFSNAPMRTIEEWKGKRVRVNNAGMALVANQLGAHPTALTAAEVLPGLQRGVIDAVVTDTCWAYGAGFYTAVKYGADWRLGTIAPLFVLVNTEAWTRLPADLKKMMQDEFAAMEKDLTAEWEKRVAAMPGLWKAKGVTFDHVSDSEMQRVYADQYMKPAFEAWYKAAAAKGVDAPHWEQVAREAVR